MAQNFIACDREQELLLPPSLREWLPEDHLEALAAHHGPHARLSAAGRPARTFRRKRPATGPLTPRSDRDFPQQPPSEAAAARAMWGEAPEAAPPVREQRS